MWDYVSIVLYKETYYKISQYTNCLKHVMSSYNVLVVLLWQKFEKKYNNELMKGAVSKDTKFEYAWCLIRSKYTDDIKKGIALLEGKLMYCMFRLWHH